MRYVRPFDIDPRARGAKDEWLVDAADNAGCTVRVRGAEGSAGHAVAEPFERFALILAGEAQLQSAAGTVSASAGDLIFIPARQAASITGTADAAWMEINAAGAAPAGKEPCRVIKVDMSRFEGEGFAHQRLIDRKTGAGGLCMNILQVQPGAGSPNFHIHAFDQMYIILEGEMTIDVGRARLKAAKNTFVYLPAGVVHRNFNASDKLERHVSLLVPEPQEGEIFDFATTIHNREAELLKTVPADPAAA